LLVSEAAITINDSDLFEKTDGGTAKQLLKKIFLVEG
jgi:hypothetical protein